MVTTNRKQVFEICFTPRWSWLIVEHIMKDWVLYQKLSRRCPSLAYKELAQVCSEFVISWHQ
jgi:hypothetical protein